MAKIKRPKSPVDAAIGALAASGRFKILSRSPEWLSVRSVCDPEVVDPLLASFEALQTGLPEGLREQIATAFREILQNALEHGCQFDPRLEIEIDHICTSRLLLLRVRDPGPGFSRLRLHHAAVSNPQAEPLHHNEVREQQGIRPGGYGILIAQRTMDEVLYNEKGNDVLLIKYLR